MTGTDEPDTVQLGAALRAPIAGNAELAVGYTGRFGDDYDAHAASLTFRIAL